MSDNSVSDNVISDAQLDANRANAQHSTGPRTPEGRRRSSGNSFKHGLTGRNVYIPAGEMPLYEQLVTGIIDSLRPSTALELQLAREIADGHWRLSRMKSIEDAILSSGELPPDVDPSDPAAPLLSQAEVVLKHQSSFSNIALYEQRTHRTIKSSLAELRKLQTDRAALHKRDMPAAMDRYKEREMRNLPFDPAADGFVFSLDEIEDALHAEYREKQVGTARTFRFSRAEFEKRYPPKAA